MARILSKDEWRRRKRLKRGCLLFLVISLFVMILIISTMFILVVLHDRYGSNNKGKESISETLSNGEVVQSDYLTPNPYSRPQTRLNRVNGVVIHYTANPGTTADNNRSYFEGLRVTKTTYASSHFIIGLKGEVLQCIPLTERSNASNDRNDDTISIECCHYDETGEFSRETYESLVSLTAALCVEFHLDQEDVIRHYDVTGKLCPLYYVEHEDAWLAFKTDVMTLVETLQENTNSLKQEERINEVSEDQ